MARSARPIDVVMVVDGDNTGALSQGHDTFDCPVGSSTLQGGCGRTMLLGNTGVFQPRDRGHHAWWLKIFPLFRNFYAELSNFRTGCPPVVTSIRPCSTGSPLRVRSVTVAHTSPFSSLSPEREETAEVSGATTCRPEYRRHT